MISGARHFLFFFVITAAVAFLQGCGSNREPDRQMASASGTDLSDEERALDPVQANINARRRVNPSPNAPSAGYHVSADDPAGTHDPSNFRVLKLEPQMPDTTLAPYIPPRLAKTRAAETPAIKPSAVPPDSPPPVLGTANVTGVRIGNYPEKVRVVLDVSAASAYTSSFGEGNKFLYVELPGIGWSAELDRVVSNPMVRSYHARSSASGLGTSLVIELAQPSRLIASMALPPNETYGHRLVFDIGAL